MDVVIRNKRISLHQADLIGAGGEGNVFKSHIDGTDLAVKIYHSPTTQRSAKLQELIATQWQLPLNKLALPQDLVFDSQGNQIIGLTMPYLGTGFEEVTNLSNKKYRSAFLVNTRLVVDIFLDGAKTLHAIHSNNLCIGDFNDLNALFRGNEMLFIDVDAWQFGKYPCPVGTEQFLVPELYGIDLSLKPMFKPEYDWYSYAVMLFKSLLLTHPYGGIHKDYKQLIQRAKHRVTVFDPGIIYPQIAIAPDLLNDELSDTFKQIFHDGKRGPFPTDQLQAYADSLVKCKNCGTFYPNSRKNCPVCSEATMVVVLKPTSVNKGATVEEFIRTNGRIVYSRVVGAKVFVIAYENGKAVLYMKAGKMLPVRTELFDEIAGAKFELVADKWLAINLPNQTEVMVVDISGNRPQAITKVETATFAGNRRSIFRSSNQYLFRITGGTLLYGEIVNNTLIERPLRSVMPNQTWFTVKQESMVNKPTAFGFFQVMSQQIFWLNWEGHQYDNLALAEMEVGEVLIDISVKFSGQGLVVRRQTQYQGVTYLRTDLVTNEGAVTFSSSRERQETHPAPYIHGQAYSTAKFLHATDKGVVQEQVDTGAVKEFAATKGHVAEGNTLYTYQGGLLVVQDSLVSHIVLTN